MFMLTQSIYDQAGELWKMLQGLKSLDPTLSPLIDWYDLDPTMSPLLQRYGLDSTLSSLVDQFSLNSIFFIYRFSFYTLLFFSH